MGGYLTEPTETKLRVSIFAFIAASKLPEIFNLNENSEYQPETAIELQSISDCIVISDTVPSFHENVMITCEEAPKRDLVTEQWRMCCNK